MKKPETWQQRVFVGAIVLLWVGQTAVMVLQGNWGWNTLAHAWQQPLAWRSARFYRSTAFANKVALLRANIPPEASVVLPPPETDPGIGREREMEWFLFPRHLTNCLNTTCMQQKIAAQRDFVVWVPDAFPQKDVSAARWQFHSAAIGVIAPTAAAKKPPQPDRPLTPLRWLCEAAAELALFALMAWGGWGMTRHLGKPDSHQDLLVAWAAGSGGLTFGVYLLLLSGLPLRAAAGIAFLGMAGLGLWGWKQSDRAMPLRLRLQPPSGWKGWALMAGWVFLLAVLAVGKGYHATDALGIWGIKGYGIAHWGLRQGTYLGFVRDYPLHVPLLIALPKALWGDLTGISKMVFPLFLLTIATVLYRETYHRTRSETLALLGAALWTTAPLLVHHAQIAYANLAAACYIFLGVWLWHEKQEGLLAGVMLAWGVWTRPEGWIVAGVVLAAGALSTPARRVLGKVALPPAAMFVFWLLTRRLAYAYRFAPGVLKTFLPGVAALLHGKIYPDVLWAVVTAWRRFLWLHLWGVVGLLGLLGLAGMAIHQILTHRAGGNSLWKDERSFMVMAASGLGIIAAVSGIYYFTAYLSEYNIQWWLNTGFDRMNLPAMAILWYAAWVGGIAVWHSRNALQPAATPKTGETPPLAG